MPDKVQSKSSRHSFSLAKGLAAFFAGLSFVSTAWAEGDRLYPGEANSSFEKSFIDTNIVVAEWLDGVAEGLDLFLAGKRLTDKKNETSVKLENSTFYKERQEPQNSGSINLNLRLPNVEEYWQLKFTSYDETKEKGGAERGNLRKAPRERNYGASVGLFQKLGDVRMAFQPRIALQDPLKVSHSLVFESVADLKTYRVNPKLEFFGNPDDGTGIFVALNFNFELSKVHSLTVINDGEYKSKSHLFSGSNGISIGQVRTKTTSISYNLFFDSNNKTNYHLEAYTISVAWNHLIYKNILDYQISPYYEFPRERNFVGIPGLTFTVALNF
jgi:hypothetical protein